MLEQKYIDRFWTYVKVAEPDACWTWTAAKTKTGHGYFNVKLNNQFKQIGAHKVSVMIQGITIPLGTVVMHLCDNPSCVNPRHLRIGTYSDNVQDMLSKGRDNYSHGQKRYNAAITDDIAKKIKTEAIIISGIPGRKTNKTNFNEIAKKYNVSRDIVSNIANNRGWKHINV